MKEVRFYDSAEDRLLKFAVIGAKYHGKWIFCRHKKRSTWEMPGGHRENGEAIEETARRELYEETGALEFQLKKAGIYSVRELDQETEMSWEKETFGALYLAKITKLGALPDSEIGEIQITETLPAHWTYEEVQPFLLKQLGEIQG